MLTRMMLAASMWLLPLAAAHAAGPEPGEYATTPGWGSLVVAETDAGRRSFVLETVGANGHMCGLEGEVEGTAAVAEIDVGEACRMRFAAAGDRVEVRQEGGDCRWYCGMRAGFEGEYLRLPAGCTPAARERRRAAALDAYRAGRHLEALGGLEALEAECGGFFDWLERDRAANDRAIALWQLGRPDACLAALDGTLAADSRDEASFATALQARGMVLPPSDWESYLPIARATWFNRAKCERGAGAERTQPFPWPGGRRAAVSLAYDDALDSQLDNALPALDRYGFKASFFLTLASDVVARRMPEWRAAAANGHELGNHSLFHQCSGSLPDRGWVVPERDLDTTTAARMRDQVLLASVMLQALDGRRERTFTAPCGETATGDGDYAALVAPAFVAIKRGVGPTDLATLDPHAVPVEAPAGVPGSALIARVEEAARAGGMVNFTFHGIGGDHLAVSAQAHEELLQHLAAHPEIYWVDTFLEIMTHVRKMQALPAE